MSKTRCKENKERKIPNNPRFRCKKCSEAVNKKEKVCKPLKIKD